MNPHAQLRAPLQIDWEPLATAIRGDVLMAFQNGAAFMSAMTARGQCDHTCRILREGRTPAVPFSMIRRIFAMNQGTVKRHYRRYLEERQTPSHNGRPSILNEEQHAQLVAEIERVYACERPLMTGGIQEFIRNQFHRTLNETTLAHMLAREPRLKSCVGIPMESTRLAVTPEQIEAFFHEAIQIIEGVPAHFVFNMDEMDHQEWADRNNRICIV
jgi:hypothetical protein